jgi:hypothetical protein
MSHTFSMQLCTSLASCSQNPNGYSRAKGTFLLRHSKISLSLLMVSKDGIMHALKKEKTVNLKVSLALNKIVSKPRRLGYHVQIRLRVRLRIPVRISIRIPIRFDAHPISHTIRIGAYFKLHTILFSGKLSFPPCNRLKCTNWTQFSFCLPIPGEMSFLTCCMSIRTDNRTGNRIAIDVYIFLWTENCIAI